MTQSIDNQLIHQLDKTAAIARIEPNEPPKLIDRWVVWELNSCINTNGIKLNTGQLHDILKAELKQQETPIDIFFAKNACWIIEGIKGIRAKVDDDLRARVVATLKNSPYTDMQFIAGIDYFGNSDWADIQMMLIVQPEKLEIPAKPIKPQEPQNNPLLPKEALIVLAIIAGGLLIFGNAALKLLGFMGIAGSIYLFIKSNADIKKAQEQYQRKLEAYEQELANWEQQKEQIIQDREELMNHRLSRSFKLDDLRVFHTVMTRSIAKIIIEGLIKKGASIKESVENNDAENAIPNTKAIFDDF